MKRTERTALHRYLRAAEASVSEVASALDAGAALTPAALQHAIELLDDVTARCATARLAFDHALNRKPARLPGQPLE